MKLAKGFPSTWILSILVTISPSWLIARGKKRVIERRRMLNMERQRKAVSAVTTFNDLFFSFFYLKFLQHGNCDTSPVKL